MLGLVKLKTIDIDPGVHQTSSEMSPRGNFFFIFYLVAMHLAGNTAWQLCSQEGISSAIQYRGLGLGSLGLPPIQQQDTHVA